MTADKTVILVIDFQERLCAAMPTEVVAQAEANILHLLALADALSIPVVATEQYPKGLGPTRPEVLAAMPSVKPLPKTHFSIWQDVAARAALEATERTTVVIVGMETHVCVWQTARDLLDTGYAVEIVTDAVTSRTKQNWRIGLELAASYGAELTSTEAVLFDLLKVASGPVFKMISKRLR